MGLPKLLTHPSPVPAYQLLIYPHCRAAPKYLGNFYIQLRLDHWELIIYCTASSTSYLSLAWLSGVLFYVVFPKFVALLALLALLLVALLQSWSCYLLSSSNHPVLRYKVT